jgi:hypothetical protein
MTSVGEGMEERREDQYAQTNRKRVKARSKVKNNE